MADGFQPVGDHIVTEYYRTLLVQNNFLPAPCPEKFSPAGQCWQVAPAVGCGYNADAASASCRSDPAHGRIYPDPDTDASAEYGAGVTHASWTARAYRNSTSASCRTSLPTPLAREPGPGRNSGAHGAPTRSMALHLLRACRVLEPMIFRAWTCPSERIEAMRSSAQTDAGREQLCFAWHLQAFDTAGAYVFAVKFRKTSTPRRAGEPSAPTQTLKIPGTKSEGSTVFDRVNAAGLSASRRVLVLAQLRCFA